jgi:Protein of unknown function (DUF1214)
MAHDNESRCFVDTGSYPDRSSRDDIVKNADGSVDLYFGPTPPQGKPASNWIKTLPQSYDLGGPGHARSRRPSRKASAPWHRAALAN